MTINRPSSNKKPGEQSAKSPSGKKVPMAMSMMVDSMVRMIQKGNNEQEEKANEGNGDQLNEY